MFCENMNLNKRFHFQDSKVEPGQKPNKSNATNVLRYIFKNNN